MGRRLNTTVHVHLDGETRVFGPGEKVPRAYADLITAPDVWEDEPSVTVTVTGDLGPYLTEMTKQAELTAPAGSEQPSTPAGASADAEVPKKNASTGAWRAYADAQGFDVDEDMSRADIIAALEANDVPTE